MSTIESIETAIFHLIPQGVRDASKHDQSATELNGFEAYEEYLLKVPNLFQHFENKYRYTVPYKAQVEYIFQQNGLADIDTRLVLSDDQKSIQNVINGLRLKGRTNIWASVATPFGENNPDPNEKYRVSTPIFRETTQPTFPWKKTLYDHKKNLTLEKYVYENPATILKIFPQDGKEQSNLALVIGANDFALKIKLNSHTTREINGQNSKELSISGVRSPLNQDELIVFTDDLFAVNGIHPLLNSSAYLSKFDSVIKDQFPTLKTMNPELMINIPGNNVDSFSKSKILFLIDFISGLSDNQKCAAMNTRTLVNMLPSAHVLPTSFKPTIAAMGVIFDYLTESSHGNPPNQGDLPVIALNQEILLNTIADFGNTSTYLTYLIELINRTQLHTGRDATFTSTGKHLNMLYQKEKPTAALVAKTHSLLKNTINAYPTVEQILYPNG
jgi:hypothetical protein